MYAESFALKPATCKSTPGSNLLAFSEIIFDSGYCKIKYQPVTADFPSAPFPQIQS
jgi:hypothetical protein